MPLQRLKLPRGVSLVQPNELRTKLPPDLFEHPSVGPVLSFIAEAERLSARPVTTGHIGPYLDMPAPPAFEKKPRLSIAQSPRRTGVHSSFVQRAAERIAGGKPIGIMGIGATLASSPTYSQSASSGHKGPNAEWVDTTISTVLSPGSPITRLIGGPPRVSEMPPGRRTAPVTIFPIETLLLLTRARTANAAKAVVAKVQLEPGEELFGGRVEQAIEALHKAGYKNVGLTGLVHGKSNAIRWSTFVHGLRSNIPFSEEGMHALTGVILAKEAASKPYGRGGSYPAVDAAGNSLPTRSKMHIHTETAAPGTSHVNSFLVGDKGGYIVLVGSKSRNVQISNVNLSPGTRRKLSQSKGLQK